MQRLLFCLKEICYKPGGGSDMEMRRPTLDAVAAVQLAGSFAEAYHLSGLAH